MKGAEGDGLGEEDGRTWATIEALPGAHAVPYRLRLRGWLSGRVRGGMGALLTRGDASKISAEMLVNWPEVWEHYRELFEVASSETRVDTGIAELSAESLTLRQSSSRADFLIQSMGYGNQPFPVYRTFLPHASSGSKPL